MSGDISRENGKLGGRPKVWTDEFMEQLADELYEWLKKPTSPWFEGFFIERGLSPKHIAEHAKKNEKFGEAYEFAKECQKQRLLEGGLLNKFNYRITMLLLSQYGIREQTEVHHQGAAPVQVVHWGKEAPRQWESNSQ